MAARMMLPPGCSDFLLSAGWADAAVEPLAGDASFRRYFRVTAPGRRAILMDAPPPQEDPRPFIEVARYLSDHGFSAPAILASDLRHGLVLLEDFGDERMREAVDAAPDTEAPVYTDVVRLLARLHRLPPASLPAYSEQELMREARLFTQWYCPAVDLPADADCYAAAWGTAFARIKGPTVTVLRDYHAENIMLIAGRYGEAALGLLDFQDALVGHPAYDLVSLLQDARRTVSPAVEADMRAVYADLAQPGPDFDTAYAILGAQRNAKILGIFTRLWKRDGKARYLGYLPRVWCYLERDLAHPALAEVADWFAANIPHDRRASAWTER